MRTITFFTSIMLLSLFSSNKEEQENIKPYFAGRVVLMISDTPVPNAIVRFLDWAPSTGLLSAASYVV